MISSYAAINAADLATHTRMFMLTAERRVRVAKMVADAVARGEASVEILRIARRNAVDAVRDAGPLGVRIYNPVLRAINKVMAAAS